jgi:hypothetical protein
VPRAITKLTFKLLPEVEQAALRGGIAALNAVTAYKDKRAVTTAREVTAAAFASCEELQAPATSDALRDSIKATAKSRGWSHEEIEVTRAADVQKSYDINFVAAVVQMGDLLEQLINNKRLLARGDSFGALAATFNSNVLFEPARVVLNEKGFAEIDVGMKFKTALGLVAWTVIKFSQLRSHGHVLLRCAECGEFKIASIRKPQRFCKAAHRNIHNVHQFRARARKHK